MSHPTVTKTIKPSLEICFVQAMPISVLTHHRTQARYVHRNVNTCVTSEEETEKF